MRPSKALSFERNQTELKELLLSKAFQFNSIEFIEHDPISIPHLYSEPLDIEIAAFLTATISWGNRKAILASASKMMHQMGASPADFVLQASKKDLNKFPDVIHRTFNREDFEGFIRCLRHVLKEKESLESAFRFEKGESNSLHAITRFRNLFFAAAHAPRAEKHLSNPMSGSAAKRINMFLRWMVRRDQRGVDFGLWQSIQPSVLSIPLDVHSGQIARKLGLLERKQNDWKAVEELDAAIRSIHPDDPVLLDYALFGLGAIEQFHK